MKKINSIKIFVVLFTTSIWIYISPLEVVAEPPTNYLCRAEGYRYDFNGVREFVQVYGEGETVFEASSQAKDRCYLENLYNCHITQCEEKQ